MGDDEFSKASVGESGKCLHVNCDEFADVAVKCDTGQIKHYCDDHHDGRRAGNALIVDEKRLSEESPGDDPPNGKPEEVPNVAEPTPEHVSEVGYNRASGQAQQIVAQYHSERIRKFSRAFAEASQDTHESDGEDENE